MEEVKSRRHTLTDEEVEQRIARFLTCKVYNMHNKNDRQTENNGVA